MRSNCALAAFHIWLRLGGRPMLVTAPHLGDLPWSLLPHVGVEVAPGWLLHFRVTKDGKGDFPFWFRGRLRRDWLGPP